MDELIKRLMANNFAELRGLNVSGDIPVKQEIINEFIAAFLKDGVSASASPSPVSQDVSAPAAPAAASAAAAASSSPLAGMSKTDLLKLVRDLKVTADDGKVNIHFVVGVE